MKKILIAISIFMLLICAGCVPKLNPIETGEYYADGEKENKVFKKAKLEIYEITKEEYELANGINVFEDATYRGKENHRYLSIKIYVYSEETQNYELVTLSEIKFAEGTPQGYLGKSYLKIGDTEYNGGYRAALDYFPTSKDIGLFTDQDGYEEDFLFKLNNQNEGEN
mgnify:FL=1